MGVKERCCGGLRYEGGFPMKNIVALLAALALTLSLFSVASAEIKSSCNLSDNAFHDAVVVFHHPTI